MKISLAWLQREVASCTEISTGVPGFLFLAERSWSIIPSIQLSSCAAIVAVTKLMETTDDRELDSERACLSVPKEKELLIHEMMK